MHLIFKWFNDGTDVDYWSNQNWFKAWVNLWYLLMLSVITIVSIGTAQLATPVFVHRNIIKTKDNLDLNKHKRLPEAKEGMQICLENV